MEVLVNAMLVIILQYRNVLNQDFVCLKFTKCYVSVLSQESWGRGWEDKRKTKA